MKRLPALREALVGLGKMGVTLGRANLEEGKVNASGLLSRNLRYFIVETKTGYTLAWGARGEAAKYALYADQGRGPGKMPPVQKIKMWIKVKPVKLRHWKTGRFQKRTEANINSAAFLIARSIGEKGTEGSKFMTNAIEKLKPEIAAVEDAFAADVRAILRTPRRR